jgi:hypothetical protein
MRKSFTALALILALAGCTRTEYIDRIQVVGVAWRSGELPVDRLVVGAWRKGDALYLRTVVMDATGQVYEYWHAGVPMWLCESRPDYWFWLPED